MDQNPVKSVWPKVTNRVALIGEAPGKDETFLGEPFVGASGQELTRMLEQVGIVRAQCFLGNVLEIRPEDNKIENCCVSKADAVSFYDMELSRLMELWPDFKWPLKYDWPAVSQGKYLHPRYLDCLPRLKKELTELQPNVIVALGNTACWALLGGTGISKIRGTVHQSQLVPGVKVIPTYHPSAVLRQWQYRPVAVSDLAKVVKEMAYPEIRREIRKIWIPETLADLEAIAWDLPLDVPLTADVETARGMVTCIGFSPSQYKSYVIPFVDRTKKGYNYWPTPELEVHAWTLVRCILMDPTIIKVFQNGMYDIQYLWRQHGIPVLGFEEDSMILHHALWPELPKGLDFLGSVYANEIAWKRMRQHAKSDTEKKDE